MADVFKEKVYLVEFYAHTKDPDPPCKFVDNVLHVRDEAHNWHPIRAAFRYVTQTPW